MVRAAATGTPAKPALPGTTGGHGTRPPSSLPGHRSGAFPRFQAQRLHDHEDPDARAAAGAGQRRSLPGAGRCGRTGSCGIHVTASDDLGLDARSPAAGKIPVAYLSAEFRVHRVPADLQRWPRRAGGRPDPRCGARCRDGHPCQARAAWDDWWSWNPATIKLFRDIDPERFRASKHNAYMITKTLTPERLRELANDALFRAQVDRAHRELRAYMSPRAIAWASTHAAPLRVRPVAYLSAEFGVHESLPIYSGGLGVLAGDHVKTASDLGLPLVAVGLFYRESYFRQHIDREGQQHAQYVTMPVESTPVAPVLDERGQPVIIDVPLASETLLAQVSQINVGRSRLLLAGHRRRRKLGREPEAGGAPLFR